MNKFWVWGGLPCISTFQAHPRWQLLKSLPIFQVRTLRLTEDTHLAWSYRARKGGAGACTHEACCQGHSLHICVTPQQGRVRSKSESGEEITESPNYTRPACTSSRKQGRAVARTEGEGEPYRPWHPIREPDRYLSHLQVRETPRAKTQS